ncbi:MAG TPA: non-heme iron oxygenase ferredoxin subunit [Candidatus Dormibacteraeota bacterium]|nr:non-heme iron oxygenase ferredoxin subunit [Candidatus Dormibacteraeota bacterium]
MAAVSDIAIDTVKAVIAEGQEICLGHCEDGFFAIDDVCTHENFLLSGGEMVEDCEVECPQHGSRFNLKTGKVTGLPAVIPAKTFAVTVEGSDVYVDV